MKTQLNEIKRMQQLAGILNENESSSVDIKPNDLVQHVKGHQDKNHHYKVTSIGNDGYAKVVIQTGPQKGSTQEFPVQDLKLFQPESQLNEVELKLADLGPDFEKTVKEIFGETAIVKDIDISYRPSADTGGKPHLYMSVTIPQTKESPKGVMLNIGFFNKEGKGIVKYDNYSQDKAATSEEFENKLIPAFKKAAAVALGKIVKDPNQLNQSTVGSGYKYDEKDQADLDKYISELPNVPLVKESFDNLDEMVDKVLSKLRSKK
jgi:hypothetical protein